LIVFCTILENRTVGARIARPQNLITHGYFVGAIVPDRPQNLIQRGIDIDITERWIDVQHGRAMHAPTK